MEPVINCRLVWYLESHKLFTTVLCGFKSRHSTVDHLFRLEMFCREAFIYNQHLFSFLFGEGLGNTMEVWDYEGPPWLWPKRTLS